MNKTTNSSDVISCVSTGFLTGVYNWMTLGLGLTALTSYFVSTSSLVTGLIYSNPLIYIALIIAQFALVLGISGGIHKMSGGTASFLFLLYSVLNGAMLSSVFLVHTTANIFQAFIVCVGMFGIMSIYGATTKKDLSSWGSFLFMGLIGICIAGLVNLFFSSDAVSFALSIVGVIVFVGLTAYDTQKLKVLGESAPTDDALAIRRGTILGALTLYLDFINLFLFLLRLFSRSR